MTASNFIAQNRTRLEVVHNVRQVASKVVLVERDDVEDQRRYDDVEAGHVVVVAGEDGFSCDVAKFHCADDRWSSWFKLPVNCYCQGFEPG